MSHAMTQREPFSIIGVGIRTSNDNADQIGALWQKFMTGNFSDRIDGRVNDDVVAVYCEYEGDHTKPYTFMLGCAAPADAQVPAGMTRRDLPGGRFAVFPSEGEQPQALMRTWAEIWTAPIERRFDSDYEIHPDDPSGIVHVYVGA